MVFSESAKADKWARKDEAVHAVSLGLMGGDQCQNRGCNLEGVVSESVGALC